MQSKKIFYGWFVVFGAFLIATATIGLHYNLIGLYYPHITAQLGYSNSQLGLFFITALSGTTVITSLFLSKIYAKISIRFAMGFSGILSGFIYIGYSFATKPIEFILLSMVLGYCIASGTVAAFSILTTRWFIHKRGFALSIIAAGTGLAGVFFSGYLSSIIEASGYQRAFFVEGLIMIALTLVGVFFIRSSPESMNLAPLTVANTNSSSEKSVQHKEVELHSLALKEALKEYPIYALAITLFLMNGTVVTFLSQYASYFKSLNFEANTIALIMAGLGASLTINKIFYGVLIDKLGIQGANYFLFFAWLATVLSLIFAELSPIIVIIFVVFSGNLAVVTTVATPLWIANMFGDKHYTSFIGIITASANVGAMIFPILVGYFIDSFGYKAVFSVTFVIMFILATLMRFAIKSANKTRLVKTT